MMLPRLSRSPFGSGASHGHDVRLPVCLVLLFGCLVSLAFSASTSEARDNDPAAVHAPEKTDDVDATLHTPTSVPPALLTVESLPPTASLPAPLASEVDEHQNKPSSEATIGKDEFSTTEKTSSASETVPQVTSLNGHVEDDTTSSSSSTPDSVTPSSATLDSVVSTSSDTPVDVVSVTPESVKSTSSVTSESIISTSSVTNTVSNEQTPSTEAASTETFTIPTQTDSASEAVVKGASTSASFDTTATTHHDATTFTEVSTPAANVSSSREMKQLSLDVPEEELGCDCRGDHQSFPSDGCPGGRTAVAARCPCRLACARQTGQACSSTAPCDAEFGLTCDPDTSTCQGKLLVQKAGVTHNSITLRWRPPAMDTGAPQQTLVGYATHFEGPDTVWQTVEPKEFSVHITGLQPNTDYFVKVEENGVVETTLVRTKDGCILNSTLSYAVGETFHLGCEQTCTCRRGGRKECQERRCEGSSCDEADSCCEALCRQRALMPSAPAKVLVTRRGPSALTLAWDDFRPTSHESSYVVEYRPAAEPAGSPATDAASHEKAWSRIQGTTVPMATIEHLQPNTPYQVRVFIWEDLEAQKPGLSSEVVTLYTEDGCVHENQSYAVGESYARGCEERCECRGTGSDDACRPRCAPPYHRPQSPPDPNCMETPAPEDPSCCVVLRCSSGQPPSSEDQGTKADVALSHDDKKGLRFEGCEYNNKTYTIGESFEDGCEARCLCDGPGHMSCLPRCPQDNEGPGMGDRCREVPDPKDSCCKLVLCEPPGDKDTVESPEGLPLTVEGATALNGTAVRLRVILPVPPPDQAEGPANAVFQVWYSPVDAEMASWTKLKVFRNQLRAASASIPVTSPGSVFELDVAGLTPNTGYYLKLVQPGEKPTFSNTVHVKTFSMAVKSVFRGCFYHNQTYEAGQRFEVGCEYICVCHKTGAVECRERCETFVDLPAGRLDRCQWVPAPDDACCTVPLCDHIGGNEGTPPMRGPGERGPPERRPPSNEFIPREQAYCLVGPGQGYRVGERWEVGEGCARRVCSCVLHPNGTVGAQCEGRCPALPASVRTPTADCPRPVVVTPDDPCVCPHVVCDNAITSYNVPPPVCVYKGKAYNAGEEFYEGCRAICHCGLDLQVSCLALECPPPHPDCIEWEHDPSFVPSPPNCCAPAKCKNDGSCIVEGVTIKNFHQVPTQLVECGSRCVCVQGNLSCESRCPVLPDRAPTTLPCPPNLAYKGHLPGDNCCVHWMCRDPQTVAKDLENVSIVVMNATTVRVRFSLPHLLVGLTGHAELRYATDAAAPRSTWRVQKFARPNRLFDTPNIEYYMSSLRDDTTYFFQVRIHLDPLQGGPESEVFKIRMPPLPTTTTTTTPLPPVIRVEAGLQVAHADARTLNITWTPLEPRERDLLDGLLVQYRRVGEVNALRSSPLIHRSRTWYVLRDLEPDTAYTVDLRYLARPGLPTTLLTSKHLEARTLVDPLNFKATLRAAGARVDASSAEMVLEGVPQPLSKYVHVIRVTYRTDADKEQSVAFKVPKSEKLVLETLKPGRRYKVWVDLYLTNGKTVTSNVIEFMTKAASPTSVRIATTEAAPVPETTAHPAAALHSELSQAGAQSYYVALIIVAVLAALTGLGFFTLLAVVLRRQASSKAPISKVPAVTSESAYDNPTYKTYDGEKEEKNGLQP